MKITLPAQLNPISRRKDKSVKLSFETRELSPEETMTLMSMESEEGWLVFAGSQEEAEKEKLPNSNPGLNTKSQAERIRAVLYKLYIQDTEDLKDLKFVGTFENYYKEKTEKYIEFLKKQIHES